MVCVLCCMSGISLFMWLCGMYGIVFVIDIVVMIVFDVLWIGVVM